MATMLYALLMLMAVDALCASSRQSTITGSRCLCSAFLTQLGTPGLSLIISKSNPLLPPRMPGDDPYPHGPPALVDPKVVHVSRAADSADLQRGDSARGPAALATALDTALAQPGNSAQHAEHLA